MRITLITFFASECLPVVKIGAHGETRTHDTGFAIRRLSRLATRAKLERKERFELSNRVWKTRMFPATSLPRVAQAGGFGPRFGCGVREFLPQLHTVNLWLWRS